MNATPSILHAIDGSQKSMQLLLGLGTIIYDNPAVGARSSPEEIRGQHTHFTRKTLDYYGLGKFSCIPRIKLFPSEIFEAKKLVEKIQNPVVLKYNDAGNSSRSLSPHIVQEIIDNNPQKTFVNFTDTASLGVYNEKFGEIRGAINLKDIPLRLVAACYYLIGKYVGADTGNYHIMLAVGGKCDVLIPEDREDGYCYPMHLYPEDSFREDEKRINYIKKIAKIKKSIIGVSY
jgi:hypothetical protein